MVVESDFPNSIAEEKPMVSLKRKTFTLPWVIPLLLVFIGCVPTIKSNVPELEARARDIKKILLLPPQIEVSELTAGGVKEKRDDWCEMGCRNVEAALVNALMDKGVHVVPMKVTPKNKKDIAEINALYRAVAISIYQHTFMYEGNLDVFQTKIEKFDYSIGSVENLLAEQRAEGLLLVFGADEISTDGRKALQVLKALNPFDQTEGGGVTSMVLCVTDKTGAVLWFRIRAQAGSYDLRDSGSTHAFVKSAVREYPGGAK
jgi:hypothetical protein